MTWVTLSWGRKCLLPQDWRKGFTWLMIDPFCHHFHFQPKLTTSAVATSSRIKRGEKWWLMREGFFLTFCRDFFSITYLSNSYSKHPFFTLEYKPPLFPAEDWENKGLKGYYANFKLLYLGLLGGSETLESRAFRPSWPQKNYTGSILKPLWYFGIFLTWVSLASEFKN